MRIRFPEPTMGFEMTSPDPRIVIALQPGAESLAGNVQVIGEADRPFTGWLGLLSALERSIDLVTSPSGARPGGTREIVDGPGVDAGAIAGKAESQ